MKKKFIYITIESKVRELDSKILIALEAISKDYVVIIGSKIMIRLLKILPKGIFFYKDLSYAMEKKFRKIKHFGNKILVHDEEGFVQSSWDDYLNMRIKFNTINYVDLLFAWGEEQKKAIKGYTISNNINLKIETVGHPRIDLLRFPFKNCNVQKKRNSKTILINTKLAEINHRDGLDGWVNILKTHKMIKDEDHLKFILEQRDYKKNLLNEYLALIKRLSKDFHDVEIILRPHPSENIDNWENLMADYENVKVTNKFSIGYWLNKCDLVIHTGCTTAIEGFILGKPAISFKPINENRFDVSLPDSISFTCNSEDDCIDLIKKTFIGDYDHLNYKRNGIKILKEHISSLEEDFAYKRIIKVIEDIPIRSYNISKLTEFRIKLTFKLVYFIDFLKFLLNKSNNNYNSNITKDEMIKSINSLSHALEYEKVVRVNKLANNIFLMNN